MLQLTGQFLILLLFLVILPLSVGGFFLPLVPGRRSLPFAWISGQIFLWAGFQMICVPLILRRASFTRVQYLYLAFCVISALAGFVFTAREWRKTGRSLWVAPERSDWKVWALWTVFGLLLAFQLVQSVRLTYADGDDAYYVAVSAVTQDADTMYVKLPYTGGSTEEDFRHGLAPFPLWITFLARMSGISSVILAKTILPAVLITMTYAVFAVVGGELLGRKREKLAFFMIMTQLLVLFGDYSFQTPENFLIARSRQGKAALGNLVFPMLLWFLLRFYKTLEEKKKPGLRYWLLFVCLLTTACLCSTLGALLCCMLIAVAGLCGAVCYRKIRVLPALAAVCLPCVLFAILYLKLG